MKKFIFDFSKCNTFEELNATLNNYSRNIGYLSVNSIDNETELELFRQLRFESAVAISILLEEE